MIYTKLPKSIYSLALATLVNGLGSFVFPFLALFLTLKLGYTKTEAGTFSMISMIMYVPGSLLTSKISDRISRKKVMVISQLFFSLSFILCGFAINNTKLVPILILLGLFFDGATDPARSALQTDHTNFKNRKEAFSLFYLCFNIGFGFGPALAGLFFNNYPQWIFFGNGIAGIISILIVIIFVQDHRPDEKMIEESLKGNETDKAVEGNIFKALKERPLLLSYLFINSLFWLFTSVVIFAIPLYASKIFLDAGPRLYGFLMTTNAVTVIIFTPLVVSKTKKNNPLEIIAIAILLYSIGFFLLGLTNIYILILLCVIIYTLGEVLHATNSDFFIANHTPLGHRARFSTITNLIQGVGFSVGPYIGGLLIDNFGFKQLFFISSFFVFICFVLLLILNELYKKKDQKNLASQKQTSN